MFVKVCGMQTYEHIDWAVEAGYSAAGIVMHPGSTRFCDREQALDLARYCRGKIPCVGVALTMSELSGIQDAFDYIQLYEEAHSSNLIYAGTELPKKCTYRYFLYDISRGSGAFHRPPAWLKKHRHNLIISGGLNKKNVRSVIKSFRPFGVDVSSGVESSPGIKDKKRMIEFINEVEDETR